MPRGLNPYDEARLQGRLWTPLIFGSDLSLLLRTRPLANFRNNALSTWIDESGRGNHATSVVAPSIAVVNGNPCLNFTGTQSMTANGLLTNGLVANGNPHTTVIVATGTSGTLWTIGFATSATPLYPLIDISSGLWRYIYRDNAGVIRYQAATTGITGSTGLSMLTSVVGAGLAVSLRHNTTQWSTGSLVTTNYASYTDVSIGRRSGGTNLLSGQIYAICYVARELSPKEIESLHGYLAWDCGLQSVVLPASHPFRNCPPLIGD